MMKPRSSGCGAWTAPRASRTVTERFAFAAHRHRPDRIVLSRDGRVALTISRTDITRVWDLGERSEPDRGPALQALIDHAKAVVPRCLTIEQRRTFLLRPEPPRWCIAMAKQPYKSPAWKTQDAVDEAIAKEFGTFADTALKAGDFSKALEAIDLAMKFGPGVAWLKVNRIHALMFLDRVSEARAAYLAHRGTELEDLRPMGEGRPRRFCRAARKRPPAPAHGRARKAVPHPAWCAVGVCGPRLADATVLSSLWAMVQCGGRPTRMEEDSWHSTEA